MNVPNKGHYLGSGTGSESQQERDRTAIAYECIVIIKAALGRCNQADTERVIHYGQLRIDLCGSDVERPANEYRACKQTIARCAECVISDPARGGKRIGLGSNANPHVVAAEQVGIALLTLLIKVKPLDAQIPGLRRTESPCVRRAVQTNGLAANHRPKGIGGRSHGVFVGALCSSCDGSQDR